MAKGIIQSMTKSILFVAYGGGHIAMVAPIMRALADHPDIKTQLLAPTTAGVYCKRQKIPYLGYKDFITPEDKNALAWGKKLAAEHHNPGSGIEEDEAIAYLGLSYWDLVTRHGEAGAAELWATHQRNAFLQLTVLERIIKKLQPDMVVTTNSPRSERAAILNANALGIPTLSMVDLFGLSHLYPLEANFITVLSPRVIDNIQHDHGVIAGQQFLVTGNPAFDAAFDYRGPINHAWRKQHFPTLPDNAKALLWIDDSGYFDVQTGRTHIRTPDEIATDLDSLAAATKASNAYLLIRPHPSQDRAIFDAWMERTAHPHVLLAGHVPLYPLLNASDAVATYQSTVGLEALLMQRPVIQLGYYPGKNALPLGEWNVARLVKTRADLPDAVRQTLHHENDATIQSRINALLPNERAAPKIAEAIRSIV